MAPTPLSSRKHFIKVPTNTLIEELEQVNTDTGRYYKTPAGELYPSVTTVTGLMNKASIQKWRQKVGEEEANKISNAASTRGTRIHQLCEDYINGTELDYNKYTCTDIDNWTQLKKVIDQNIDNVHLQETRLFSKYLKMAGTVDCIAEFDGKLSVVDFKTARKAKDKSYITNYFCQASAYAIMYEELFGIPVGQTAIVISVDNDDVQVFVERRDNYVKPLLEVREQYRALYNI